MLHIDRSARTRVPSAPARCQAVLRDVARYTSWASLIERADVGTDGTIALTARLLGLELELLCRLETGDDGTTVLRRLPFDADDEERYVATWTVRPDGQGTHVALHVAAELDAPGAASLLRGQVGRRLVDDLLADLAAAL